MLVDTRIYNGKLISPIKSLECYLERGGTTIVQAAFEHSYFVHPDQVRQKTPYFPDRVRFSREHYRHRRKGETALWQGQEVKLDDNSAAQRAWAKYTGRPIVRRSGYGVRHVWGHPWDPRAFTAGWNLCYMPFWAGMLTERQHPHCKLERAIRQAAWDLYFRNDPVCVPPEFVANPGIDLGPILGEQPLLILTEEGADGKGCAVSCGDSAEQTDVRIRE